MKKVNFLRKKVHPRESHGYAYDRTQESLSLEFTVNKVLIKVFRTTSLDVLAERRLWFGISEIKVLIAKR